MNQVLIQLEALLVPGLLLKWGREGKEALVTYEHNGRVETSWVGHDQVVAVPDGELAELADGAADGLADGLADGQVT